MACNAAEGVDFVHRQLANLELTKALAVVEEVGDLPRSVIMCIFSNSPILTSWCSKIFHMSLFCVIYYCCMFKLIAMLKREWKIICN